MKVYIIILYRKKLEFTLVNKILKKLKTFSIIIRYSKCRYKREVENIDAKENLIRLVNQYKNLVFSICLKMTGDYFVSEDITQDTFIAAYQKYNDFDGENEKSWICRIASNKCIDYLRSAKRRSVDADENDLPDIPEVAYDPSKIYESKAVMEEINSHCQSLPQPYAEISIQYFLQGKTAKEIAEETGTNLKTVQTRIYRAREMLKKKIRKEDLLS